MPARRVRLPAAADLSHELDAIRRELEVPESFPAEVEAEADAAAARDPEGERLDLPFVTIDPPGSRDLDQAMHIARRGDGHRVTYAIADVAAFVRPGGALDREAHARAVTVYAPDRKAPLHPPVLSEGAASLLPAEWRPAVVWTLDLDAAGELRSAHVSRAQVRSEAQHTYEDVPSALLPLLREVGERRLAIERARGGVRLAVPEQEVVEEDGGYTVRFRVPLDTEEWSAQISLLTGMAAADMMLRAGVGILRTQPAADERDLTRLRRQAAALGAPWPDRVPYAEFVRALDPAVPAQAALMQEATGVGHGAGYTAFDGAPPDEPEHFAVAAPYAHATAPLRRLQDRWVSECCLAACGGTPLPEWVRAGLPELPAAMAAGARRAGAVERAVVDLVEAVMLSGREGEVFDAVAIENDVVQLRDPAVRAKLESGCPEPGTEVRVRLERADVAARRAVFVLA